MGERGPNVLEGGPTEEEFLSGNSQADQAESSSPEITIEKLKWEKSKTEIEPEIELATEIEKEKTSGESNLEEVNSFAELYEVIKNSDPVKVGRKKHSAEELISIIKTVEEHDGKDPFRTVLIPGVEGLREKVDELLEKHEKGADGILAAAAHEIEHTREPDEVTELDEQFMKALSKKKKKDVYKEEREPDEATELEEQFMKAKAKKGKKKEVKEPTKEIKKKLDFSGVESFEDIFSTIDNNKGIEGTHGHYSPEDIRTIINEVRDRKREITYITRTDGLRKKVMELLKQETMADRLTPENIKFNTDKLDPLEIKILNPETGRIENNWMAMGVNQEGWAMVARSTKDNKSNPEHYSYHLEQLKIWNSEKNNDKLFERINMVKNYDELMEEIDLSGGIQGSQEFFDPATLKEIIRDVWENNGDINRVTRQGGLRQKVGELLSKRRENIQEKVKRIKKKPGFFKKLFGGK